MRVLGEDPATGEEITLRNGRFGEYVQQGEGDKPKRSSLPRGLSADDVTLEKALKLLALPREVARHPSSGEPILAGIGRYGAYVQHGKTYANPAATTTCLRSARTARSTSSSPRRAGQGGGRFGAAPARGLGDHPEGGPVSVKQGRFGPYVNHGKINATLPKGTDPAALTLAEAVEPLKAKAAGGGVVGRLVGEHPDGGPVTVRDGRFGAYVNWGKVNATLPKGVAPDSVTLSQALDLIAEREGRPAAQPRKPARAAAEGQAGESGGQGQSAGRRDGERQSRGLPTAGGEEGRRAQARGQQAIGPASQSAGRPMYIAIVALLTVVLPLGSALVEHALPGAAPFLALVGKWFVFWAAGVRLVLAGVRQAFSARVHRPADLQDRERGRLSAGARDRGWESRARRGRRSLAPAARFHSASRDRRRDLLRHSRLPASPGEGPQPQRNRRHGHRPLRLRRARRLCGLCAAMVRAGNPGHASLHSGLWQTASMLLPSGSSTNAP